MESIMDVLTMQANEDDQSIGAVTNPSSYLNIDSDYKPDEINDEYDSHNDEAMANDYQPVPAPPILTTVDTNGGQPEPSNGTSVQNNPDPVAVKSEPANNGDNHQSSSSNRRRHGSRSRSRNGKNRSRSRSRSRTRSRSRHRRGGRRSRSPRRRGGRRSSPGGHRSSIKHDKDNLKYRWDRTIFVSNIPYEVKWAELKDLFREKVGDSAVVYCEIYERHSDGKSLGVATIELRTVSDAERAVEVMHSYEMDGRKLSVRMDTEGFKARQARDMTGAPSSNNRRDSPERRSNGISNNGGILGMLANPLLGLGSNSNLNNSAWLNALATQHGIEGPVTKRIFVASLDYKVDESKLREVFGMAGRVRSVSLFRDRDNKSRGMALVEYDQPFDALNAVAMFNKQVLLDREMNVRFDTKPPTKEEEDQSRSSSSSKLPSGLKSIGSGLGGIGSLLGASSAPAANPLGALGLGGINPLGINTQPASNALTLGALTALAGLNSVGSGLNANSLGNSNSLGGNGLGGGGLGSSGSTLNSNSNDIGNGFNLSSSTNLLNSFSSQLLEAANSRNNSNLNGSNGAGSKSEPKNRITKIFIKNLPFSWDERRLKEKFSQAGRIEYAEIKKKDGKSRGFGMIRYSFPDQADKAVELFNGSNFDGRTLEVKLDLM